MAGGEDTEGGIGYSVGLYGARGVSPIGHFGTVQAMGKRNRRIVGGLKRRGTISI